MTIARPAPETWDRFWADKRPESIYPPVSDIAHEIGRVTPVRGKSILEIGAGTGRDSIKLAEAGATVFTLDYSSESLRLIRKNAGRDALRLVRADALACPFGDATFDIVFHQGLLEHFSSPHRLLAENRRIVKKNGFLIVDVPQTFHLYTVLKHLLIIAGRWFAGWERQFTPGALARLLARHGFQPLYYYGDWSRPGIIYKIARELAGKMQLSLPMHPAYLGRLTEQFYDRQKKLRQKKLFQYTALSIGIVAKKN